jgi:hypothetical protein
MRGWGAFHFFVIDSIGLPLSGNRSPDLRGSESGGYFDQGK